MKIDWPFYYRKHGVRNCQQLINKFGGITGAAFKTGLPRTSIATKNKYEIEAGFKASHKVLHFTDTHVQPNLPTDHLVWIGKHIKETDPDYITHGGDFADAESLCAHIQPHTLTARSKPTLKSDIACMEDAMLLLNQYSGRSDFHVTLGNHEERIWTMEENNPDLAYLLQERFDLAYKTAGWEYSKFGVYHTLHGVDFTHAPMMMANKPVGGKLSVNNVATNSIADCVYGHTHMKAEFTVKKFGPGRETTAINAGCSMPIGYIPKYIAKGATGGWWHGVIELEIENGKIRDTNYITLETLRRRYA